MKLTQALALALVACHSLLAADLGKLLRLKLGPTGRPAFGVSYSYGNDPDGTRYLLNATSQVAPTEGARQLQWNFYLESDDAFLLPWDTNRSVTLASFQLLVEDEAVVVKIIKAQKFQQKKEMFLVLADETNQAVYHLPLSQFCAQFPQNFKDLSYGEICDNPKL